MTIDLVQFKIDRAEAILSLDLAKIRAYMAKYGEPAPADNHVLLVATHKAITGCRDFPIEARRLSKAWLESKYYSSEDDGELS